LLVCNGSPAADNEQSSTEHFKIRAVSLAVKTALKSYLAASDFPDLKRKKMAEISRQTTSQFAADYKEAWTVLKKCIYLVSKYRLQQNTGKEEALKIISRLTRDECLEAIDHIPDEVIFDQFTSCLDDPEIEDKSFSEQIDFIMKKWLAGNKG
jgi:hypothetical protein